MSAIIAQKFENAAQDDLKRSDYNSACENFYNSALELRETKLGVYSVSRLATQSWFCKLLGQEKPDLKELQNFFEKCKTHFPSFAHLSNRNSLLVESIISEWETENIPQAIANIIQDKNSFYDQHLNALYDLAVKKLSNV